MSDADHPVTCCALLGARRACVAALAGCSEYLDRRDTISLNGGDAVATNKVTQMVDPWPRDSADNNIAFNGEKMETAVERYRTDRVIQPQRHRHLGAAISRRSTSPNNTTPVGPTRDPVGGAGEISGIDRPYAYRPQPQSRFEPYPRRGAHRRRRVRPFRARHLRRQSSAIDLAMVTGRIAEHGDTLDVAGATVVVVDLDAGRDDEMEALARLMARVGAWPPVIAVTQSFDENVARTLLQMRVADFLVKPVAPIDLVRACARVAQKSGRQAPSRPRRRSTRSCPRSAAPASPRSRCRPRCSCSTAAGRASSRRPAWSI